MCAAVYRQRHLVRATKVNAGLAESNGKLLLGIWRDSLHVTCGLTACTPGSAPGPTLGNELGKTLKLLPLHKVPQQGLTLVEFREDLKQQKTRVPGLSCGVVRVILCLAVLTQYWLVTDRRTHNDSNTALEQRHMVKSVKSIAKSLQPFDRF